MYRTACGVYECSGITLIEHMYYSGDTGREVEALRRLLPYVLLERCGNDPSAGSPTETLLRLHLPLNDEV